MDLDWNTLIIDFNEFVPAFNALDINAATTLLSTPYTIFDNAAKHNQLEVFSYLFGQKKKKEKKQEILKYNNFCIFKSAVLSNSTEIVQFILENISPLEKQRMLSTDIGESKNGYSAFVIAFEKENIPLVKLLLKHLERSREVLGCFVSDCTIPAYAVRNKKLLLVEEIFTGSLFPGLVDSLMPYECLKIAITACDMIMLDKLLSFPQCEELVVGIYEKQHIKNKHSKESFYSYHYFYTKERDSTVIDPKCELLYAAALQEDNAILDKLVDIIQRYYDDECDINQHCCFFGAVFNYKQSKILDATFARGNLKLFHLAMQRFAQQGSVDESCVRKFHHVAFAAACGISVSLLKEMFAYKHAYTSVESKRNLLTENNYSCLQRAVATGNKQTVELLLKIGKMNDFMEKMITSECIKVAIDNRQVNMLQLLFQALKKYQKQRYELLMANDCTCFKQAVHSQDVSIIAAFIKTAYSTQSQFDTKPSTKTKQSDSSDEESSSDSNDDSEPIENADLVKKLLRYKVQDEYAALLDSESVEVLRVLFKAIPSEIVQILAFQTSCNDLFPKLIKKFTSMCKYEMLSYLFHLFTFPDRRHSTFHETILNIDTDCTQSCGREKEEGEEITDMREIINRREYQRSIILSREFCNEIFELFSSNKNENNEESFIRIFEIIFESIPDKTEYDYILDGTMTQVVYTDSQNRSLSLTALTFWHSIVCSALKAKRNASVMHIINFFESSRLKENFGLPLLQMHNYRFFQLAIDNESIEMIQFLLSKCLPVNKGKMIHGGGKLYLLKASANQQITTLLLKESAPFFLYLEEAFNPSIVSTVLPFVLQSIENLVAGAETHIQFNIPFAIALLRYVLKSKVFLLESGIDSPPLPENSFSFDFQTFKKFLMIPQFSEYLTHTIPYATLHKCLSIVYENIQKDIHLPNYVVNTNNQLVLNLLRSKIPVVDLDYTVWLYNINESLNFTTTKYSYDAFKPLLIEDLREYIQRLSNSAYEKSILFKDQNFTMFCKAIQRKDSNLVQFWCGRYLNEMVQYLYNSSSLSAAFLEMIENEIISLELFLADVLKLQYHKDFIVISRFHDFLLLKKFIDRDLGHCTNSMLNSMEEAAGNLDPRLDEMLFQAMIKSVESKNAKLTQLLIQTLVRLTFQRQQNNICQFLFQDRAKLLSQAIGTDQLDTFQKLIGLCPTPPNSATIARFLDTAVRQNLSSSVSFLMRKYNVLQDVSLRTNLLASCLVHGSNLILEEVMIYSIMTELNVTRSAFTDQKFFSVSDLSGGWDDMIGKIVMNNQLESVKWICSNLLLINSTENITDEENVVEEMEEEMKIFAIKICSLVLLKSCEFNKEEIATFVFNLPILLDYDLRHQYVQTENYHCLRCAIENNSMVLIDEFIPFLDTEKKKPFLEWKQGAMVITLAKFHDWREFKELLLTRFELAEHDTIVLIRSFAESFCKMLVDTKKYEFLSSIWSFMSNESKRCIFFASNATGGDKSLMEILIQDDKLDFVEMLGAGTTLVDITNYITLAITNRALSVLRYLVKNHTNTLPLISLKDKWKNQAELLTVFKSVDSIECLRSIERAWNFSFHPAMWLQVFILQNRMPLIEQAVIYFESSLSSFQDNSEIMWELLHQIIRSNSMPILHFFINRLVQKRKFHEIIARQSYEIIESVIKFGGSTFDIFQYLVDHVENVDTMINTCSFRIFSRLTHHKPLDWMEYVFAKVSPQVKESAIQHYNYSAFTQIHDEAKRFFFMNQSLYCVSFVYHHRREYGEIFFRFCDQQYAELCQTQIVTEAANPNIVFDLETDKQKTIFHYIALYYLFERNHATYHTLENAREYYLQRLRYILSLPSMPTILRRRMSLFSTTEENTFIRTVVEHGDVEVLEMVLALPGLRPVAEQLLREATMNNRARPRSNTVNQHQLMEQLIQRESSMVQLSEGENHRLKKLTEKYNPILTKEGVPEIMKRLLNKLEELYNEDPAFVEIVTRKRNPRTGVITQDKLKLTLPFDWDNFQATIFQPYKFQVASEDVLLKPYYRHPVHTAWRYLQRPNRWMAGNAFFVERDSNGNGTSSFQQYAPLIALFYLAVTDPTIPSIEGHTVESRLDHFIRELALINRAHNWDRSKQRNDGKGSEEYDDLEGDKPSCYGGVKRRLFQSVLGHPLLFILTKDTIQYELHSFIRDHYMTYVTNYPEKRAIILQIIEDYIMELTVTEDGLIELQALEITEEEIQRFVSSMIIKYGKGNMERAFILQIEQYFVLGRKDPPCQVLKFVGPVGLYQILEGNT